VTLQSGNDLATVEVVGPNLARVHLEPNGKASPRTLVIDPSLQLNGALPVIKQTGNDHLVLSDAGIDVDVNAESQLRISVCDHADHCLHVDDLFNVLKHSELLIGRDQEEPLYGMRGLELVDHGEGLTRTHGATIAAGAQGDGGAPFFFTRHYGVLVDSNGGAFEVCDHCVRFRGSSRRDVEFYVAFGSPTTILSTLMKLSGLPSMPPKWTLGFLNSQWGITEPDLFQTVATYRQKQIPLDAFILDFDWKAWGEDHYGEWRWNSSSGAGSVAPDKFPDGASGILGSKLAQQGVKLAGILKPRILLSTSVSSSDSTDAKTEASAYADAHHLWYPNETPEKDYVTHRWSRILDFNLPETRTWFWDHLKPAFLAGMAGWWNDEADTTSTTQPKNFQFLNMARMLYDGQRSVADQRVWSLNRNYYLGANRYGYALWSGDIDTGFPSMSYQRRRMLAAMDLGVSHWSMDTGGFRGHPTPENYARWMEFAAWVPIDRVHGDFGEKRQPWTYGPVAEAAATKAIRTRYSLLPYLYSLERADHITGIGIVRPMFWIFPDDHEAADLDTEWMFGDALLVSPVVSPGATSQRVYLPEGVWYDFNTGRRFDGKRWYKIPVDSATWSDVPVFVRAGSILASQDLQQYVGQRPVSEVMLDVFPGDRLSEFAYYDDDGVSYRYETGEYFEQKISAQRSGAHTVLHVSAATGSFRPALKKFIVRVHVRATTVALHGRSIPKLREAGGSGEEVSWSEGMDKYGEVTEIRLPAGKQLDLSLR
jgi:alpha-glucosidase